MNSKNPKGNLAKKNYRILMTEGSLITVGRSFIDASSVASVFIDIFTGNLQLAGIVSAIRGFIAVVMQTFAGPYLLSRKNQPGIIFRGKFLSAAVLFIMPLVLLAGVGGYAAAYAFIVVYTLIWIIDGAIIVPWFMLNVRTMPHRLRNTVLTYRTFLGGTLTFACGYLIRWFLKNPDMSDSVRFFWIFSIGAVIMTVSSIFFLGMRDVDNPKLPEKKPIKEMLLKIPAVLKGNRNFSNYMVVRILSFFSSASAWFIILFGRRILGLGNGATSTLIIIQIAGGIAGGLLWSWTNHQLGTKTTIIAMRVLAILELLLAIPCILNPSGSWVFMIVMVFINGLTINLFFGDTNYMTDIIGYERNSENHMFINSLAAIPFSLINVVAGTVAEHFGFIPLFAISILASLIVIVMSPRLLSPKEIDKLHEKQLKERDMLSEEEILNQTMRS